MEGSHPDAWLGDPRKILSMAEVQGVVEITLRSPAEARGLAQRLHAQLRRDKMNKDPVLAQAKSSIAIYKDGLTIRVIDYAHEVNTGRVQVNVGGKNV